MSVEMHDVPVKAWLRPSTFRKLEHHARHRGTTVGQLLAAMADHAITPKPPKARGYFRMTPERLAEARELHQAGRTLREIAQHFGASRSTIENHKHTITRGASS